ncbi:MAG: hypothetical protein NZ805_00720 [Armatimonadetes bacterium]|nr:hypothetical protein [Armatimonadota bacterium]MDW8027312.1 hypothetical protein [Armatimonadota bacterium]
MTLFWRCLVAWSPAVLVLIWLLIRHQFPSLSWLWIGMPLVFLIVGILSIILRTKKVRIKQREMAGYFACALASLAATEASLSILFC